MSLRSAEDRKLPAPKPRGIEAWVLAEHVL